MSLRQRILLIGFICILSGCAPSTAAPTQTKAPSTGTPQPVQVTSLPTITPAPTRDTTPSITIPAPPQGYLYHGVYPGGRTGEEDDITPGDLASYEQAVGKDAAWVYFSNNWFHGRDFPTKTAEWIREAGSIPYIRLMLRNDLKYDGKDTTYSLQNIINGDFDEDLHRWCAGAYRFGTPIIVEYGTEVNSDSFAWSGIYNGGGVKDEYGVPALPDGPERFKDAYRHIIQVCRDEDAMNITWVFHMDSLNYPNVSWNRPENYYPGNEWIDWIGVSIYGAHTPDSAYFDIFSARLDTVYRQIAKFAPDKPIIIAEFGTAKDNPFVDQIQWTKDAFASLKTEQYPNLIGFSWWNEWWQNDSHAENNTTMRVQDNPGLEELFQEFIGDNPHILGEIVQ